MPDTLPMFTIRPQRCFSMWRSAALVQRNTARRFVAITSSQSSTDMRRSSVSRLKPALFTRMSSRPNASWAVSTTRSASSGTLMSPWTSTAWTS